MSISPVFAPWLESLLAAAQHYGIGVSEESVRVSLSWEQGVSKDVALQRMALQMGLTLRFEEPRKDSFNPWRLPLLVEFKDGRTGVVEKADGQGSYSVQLSSDQGLCTTLSLEQLQQAARVCLARPESSVPDVRVDQYIRPYRRNWFWNIALRDWRSYSDVVLAAFVVNVLALAGVIFSMQIYDRVVPAKSEPTLWVLFGGVAIAILFELLLRLARSRISDVIGKRADLQISDLVFGRALRIRNDARSKSTGTFIAQIRELDSVRELITSTTLTAVTDLPFVLLFMVVIYFIGGSLAIVPLAALPLLILPGVLAQRPLARLSNEGMRESAIRNALLVEAVEGIEDIKLLRAESRFQNRWNQMHGVSADIALKQRTIVNRLMTWTQEVQSIVYVTVLLVGCYRVMEGDMTTGALVGTSILASRMMAPLAQISGVFSRWQHAKVARKSLDELMKRPVDQPEHSRQLHRPVLRGHYDLQGIQFRYCEDAKKSALNIAQLKFKAGERVALLGRIGSGKSTLLNLLAGMHRPQEGAVRLDDLDLSLIDPADVRRDVGLLAQNARLFFGTLRENLTLGRPLATDEEILQALAMVGMDGFVQSQPAGLDYLILEGGVGLSGGQRQCLLLARTLIRQPHVVLLDEPTASLDEVSERHIINQIEQWLDHRTLVVATHRASILKWVDRIIVLDGGRVVMDGSKDDILNSLSSKS